jgi:hypothetical protein
MRRFLDNGSGQLILISCLFVAFALMLMATYEYSALGTGEKSIDREDMGSTYFYMNIMDRYNKIYYDEAYWTNNAKNITYFENDMKEFALLHGYSLDFVRPNNTIRATKVIFVDKDVRIEDELTP